MDRGLPPEWRKSAAVGTLTALVWLTTDLLANDGLSLLVLCNALFNGFLAAVALAAPASFLKKSLPGYHPGATERIGLAYSSGC